MPRLWLSPLAIVVLTLLAQGCRPASSSPSATDSTPVPPASSAGRMEPPAASPRTVRSAHRLAVDPDDHIRFRDATEATGIRFTHTSGNTPEKLYPTANGSGLAMLDYDGDGRLDLYFSTTRHLPIGTESPSKGNALYRNKGDGTFEDVTARAGVGFDGFNQGVVAGDVDNNGHVDLYLTNLDGNVLYLNNGDGTFRRRENSGAECGLWSSGAAMLDYDNDGKLDLYVTCYGSWPLKDAQPCGDAAKGVVTYCSPRTITPQRHFLYHNEGNATFVDATERAGILRADGRGLGVLAADLDDDGRIDLYVANDLCPHFLFFNNGDGTFTDATESSGAALSESGQAQAGMGIDAEDTDGNGLPDLFVSHFEGDYGTLYRNLGGRGFQDVSASVGVVAGTAPYVGWGCSLGDLDNDGWPDLFVANGHVDDNLAAMGRDVPWAEPAKVWRNRGDGRFRLAADPGPYFRESHVARGAAFGDLDNDGDLDAVISRMDARPAVLLNETEVLGHWIRLDLTGTRSNRTSIGASAEVHVGTRVLRRQVKGGGSYLSSNDPRLLVGLGKSERVDKVVIRWPSGTLTTLDGPAIDRAHQVIEPSGSTP
ncbi:CRTAC1 family protein [Isosphaeraceae bacterium EP7]